MKKILFVATALLLLASCAPSSYKITGSIEIPEAEGKEITLNRLVDRDMVAIDTTVIANGTFSFEGKADIAEVLFLRVQIQEDERMLSIPVFVENATIAVAIDKEKYAKVSGTELNNTFQQLTDKLAENEKVYSVLVEEYMSKQEAGTLDDVRKAEIEKQAEEIEAENNEFSLNFTSTNINNLTGQFLLSRNLSKYELEKLKEIVAKADDVAKTSSALVKAAERISTLESIAIGQKFTDIRMPNTEGVEIALSDFAGKGKYVLIDFWAAWCGPCRREMPNLVAAYKEYKDKGFEIVGVSLDRNHEDWVKGIADLGMTWPNMSDIKFWNSEASKLYAIGSIPHTVLLDKDGIIIAKDLRGEELDAKLAELLGK